jgi:hypothetical protein
VNHIKAFLGVTVSCSTGDVYLQFVAEEWTIPLISAVLRHDSAAIELLVLSVVL